LQFTNLIGSLNQENLAEQMGLLNALIELLISKGVIHIHELEQRKEEVVASLEKVRAEQAAVQLTETPDKYDQAHEVSVDCAERIAICQGICCKMWFTLSVQDLSEGIVRWNYGMPYAIAQGEDGLCVHLDREQFTCTIYPNRPLICRSYDCRNDARVWKDYEQKLFNPEGSARHNPA